MYHFIAIHSFKNGEEIYRFKTQVPVHLPTYNLQKLTDLLVESFNIDFDQDSDSISFHELPDKATIIRI